jgi:5-methylcytosine-specific restriction endonuclease McrA
MEIDSRRLYLGEGCASMFGYCTRVLHLAEGAAYNRIEAARAARSYPMILELFEQSAITLTAVRLLAPHLTAANHAAVLTSARHKSKREIEELAASLKPKPDAPMVVRKLPARSTTLAAPLSLRPDTALEDSAAAASPSTGQPRCEVVLQPTITPLPPARIAPLAPERYRIQLTVSRETHDKFRRAQALLRQAVPSGDAAEILDRAFTLLVDRLEHQRFAEITRARACTTGAARSRHIPAAVRRAVWRRDDGRCAFAGAEGRCGETAFLEFHHLEPYAAGGEASVENIELRCRARDLHEARLFFGADAVREKSACSW